MMDFLFDVFYLIFLISALCGGAYAFFEFLKTEKHFREGEEMYFNSKETANEIKMSIEDIQKKISELNNKIK